MEGWSIIITNSLAHHYVRYALYAWLSQLNEVKNAEIIFVDRCHTDTSDLPNLRVRRVAGTATAAEAKNAGAAEAAFDKLLFADETLLPYGNLLSPYAQLHEHYDVVIGEPVGKVVFATVEAEKLPFRHRMAFLESRKQDEGFEAYASCLVGGRNFDVFAPADTAFAGVVHAQARPDQFMKHDLNRPGGPASVKILSVRKSIFDAVGGFDPAFRFFEHEALLTRLGNPQLATVASTAEQGAIRQVTPFADRRNDFLHDLALPSLPPEITSWYKEATGTGSSGVLDLQKRYNAYFKKDHQKIYLTFDDGPHPVTTKALLRVLKEHQAKATFFLLGSEVKKYPELCRQIYASGHAIGIHFYHHLPISALTLAQVTREILDTRAVIRKACGPVAVKLVRPPYGQTSEAFWHCCEAHGFAPVGWDLSAEDWRYIHFQDMVINIACRSAGGKIFLFHDGVGNLNEIVSVVKWLLRQTDLAGLGADTLDNALLHELPPGTPGDGTGF